MEIMKRPLLIYVQVNWKACLNQSQFDRRFTASLLLYLLCFTFLHFLKGFSLLSLSVFLSFPLSDGIQIDCKVLSSGAALSPKLTDHPQVELSWRMTGPTGRSGPFFQFTASSDVKKSKWRDKQSISSVSLECQHVYMNVRLHMKPVSHSCLNSRTCWMGVTGALKAPPGQQPVQHSAGCQDFTHL